MKLEKLSLSLFATGVCPRRDRPPVEPLRLHRRGARARSVRRVAERLARLLDLTGLLPMLSWLGQALLAVIGRDRHDPFGRGPVQLAPAPAVDSLEGDLAELVVRKLQAAPASTDRTSRLRSPPSWVARPKSTRTLSGLRSR
ncbi:MAG: hypothetical protein HYV63_01975 [Candidatus Schekmanbacteria bacterium]|nr:hypothetical protein [Candidatus Schekmanbacteria bacterium]